MLKELIRVQWLRVRIPVILVALILFTLPLVMIRSGGGPMVDGLNEVGNWLTAATNIGRVIPVIALGLGLYLGIAAWMDDTRGRHVYALTLPIPRERYVIYRFVAAGLPMIVPAACLLAGGLTAAALVQLPPGVHAYPVALAGRTLLATLVCYAIFFAIAVSTRRAVVIVLGLILVLVVADFVGTLLELQVEVMGGAIKLLTTWPGPLAILTGNWALFDV